MPGSNTACYNAETWDIMQFLFAKYNDHQVRCVIRFDSFIDQEQLKRAVDLLTDGFPLIRCRFSERGNKPHWEDASFTADDMVFLLQTKNAEETLQAVLCQMTDEKRGPQLAIHIIRDDKVDLLCININHMLCDGTAFKELLYRLGSLYSRLDIDPVDKPLCIPGPRGTRQVLGTFGWWSKLAIMLKNNGVPKHDGTITFGLTGDADMPFILMRTHARSQFLLLKAYSKRHGVSVNDIILTAYIRTLYSMLGGKSPAIECVLDLRKYLPGNNAPGFCNLTSNLMCVIGPEIGERFDDTLKKVKAAMDIEKASQGCLSQIILLDTLFRLAPYKIAKRLVSGKSLFPPFAMSNIGIIDHRRLSFRGVKVTGAFMTGSIKYKPLVQLALSTFADQITFSVAFHGTQADKAKLDDFLMRLYQELPFAPRTEQPRNSI